MAENKDLQWDLDEFDDRNIAKRFVMKFENLLCVFSPSVRQIYTNYSMYFPREENHKMVVLPNDAVYHDTFQHIDPESVVKTGIYIMPGEVIGQSELLLAIPKEGFEHNLKFLPLKQGLLGIFKTIKGDNPVLPLLTKGDLREFETKHPSLHLHRILLDRLEERSALERSGIKNVINEKLMKLYNEL